MDTIMQNQAQIHRNNRADLHTHILPGIDDGAKNTEESNQMLELLKMDGVGNIIATPHFYLKENSVNGFIRRRNSSYEELKSRVNFDGNICLGAEVYYGKQMYRIENFESLSLGKSDYILIELPYEKKIDVDLLEDIEEMMEKTDLTVIFAHIERFFDKFTWRASRKLYSMDVIFQVNLPSMKDKKLKKAAYKFIKKDLHVVLGSDCHNCGDRSPKAYGEGLAIIEEDLGTQLKNKLLDDTKKLFDKISRY